MCASDSTSMLWHKTELTSKKPLKHDVYLSVVNRPDPLDCNIHNLKNCRGVCVILMLLIQLKSCLFYSYMHNYTANTHILYVLQGDLCSRDKNVPAHTHSVGALVARETLPLYFNSCSLGKTSSTSFTEGLCVCVCFKGLKSWKKCRSLCSFSKQDAVPARDREIERETVRNRQKWIRVCNLWTFCNLSP